MSNSKKKSFPVLAWVKRYSLIIILASLAGIVLAIYLFAPGRTNVLVLGIDYTPPGSLAGRSDTNIIATFLPSIPYVGAVSIPRDLWVNIPGYGENRINTAHFFAEVNQPGSGATDAIKTVETNFGVNIDYFLRLKFEGFKDIFNAMGGVDIDLPRPMAGYEAGKHHLTGNKALAFARNRSGSDDFFRMEQGQLIIASAFKQMLNPLKWWRIPAVIQAISRSTDTNVPVWLWPRLAFLVLRIGPDKIDFRSIQREMVTPFTTDEGAEVLLPSWNLINPVLVDMFGQ
jgi:LCP family protein required for cell wall assembly